MSQGPQLLSLVQKKCRAEPNREQGYVKAIPNYILYVCNVQY